MIWNPWKRIRELETENAILRDRIEYEQEETDRRIGHAIADHYIRIQNEERYRIAELQHMRNAVADINNLSPHILSVIVPVDAA